MANTIVQFDAPTGLTLTGKLYAENGDTIQNGASGDSATERTNALGRYTITVSEALTGVHELGVFDASGNLICLYITDALADDSSTYNSYDRTASTSAAVIADAVLDEAMSGHTTAGSLGLFLNDQYDLAITGITTGVETRAGKHSVAGTVMMSTNAALSGGTLTAKKPSDDSTFSTYTVTTDASAKNITGVS
ncbi:MAG: hypothetical protein GY903_17420 [Fuerstiella sp.]|nr:hypothetical protein [Fuerstiella sp.]